MRVPVPLTLAFGEEFEKLISQFSADQKLLSSAEEIHSTRFLSRSVVPHVQKLSTLFNRIDPEAKATGAAKAVAQADGLDPYWKESANPANLRLAYFLYFMPPNLYRMASVWAELARLGFKWPSSEKQLRAVEFGAGPASGACGIAAGEKYAPVGLPSEGNWALIEQDKKMLELGGRWAKTYFESSGFAAWDVREFKRRIELDQPTLLPPKAPKFNLFTMSFFLNEFQEPESKLADRLLATWRDHLTDEGIAILIEPALKLQSRRLLALRREILAQSAGSDIQLLLPCLGHQDCGALAAEGDWCHEEVSWWRPPYFKTIDQMANLDRKTLPFSYLVFVKSRRPREEILTALEPGATRERLVSPAHAEGKEQEFFICGQEGKRRARWRPPEGPKGEDALERGDVLEGAQIRGDRNSARIGSVKTRR